MTRTRLLCLSAIALLSACSRTNAHPISAVERAKLVKQIADFGIFDSLGSSSGYAETDNCTPKTNACHVTEGQLTPTTDGGAIEHGTVYDFPFVPAEWVNADYGSGDRHTMPAFLHAVKHSYTRHWHYVTPPPGQHYCSSTIMPGETCVIGGLLPDGPTP